MVSADNSEGETTVWDGITQVATLSELARGARLAIADAAKSLDWRQLFQLLSDHPNFINCARPGGRSLYTPLHQAAYGGAPTGVIEQLIAMGAWRTIENARGERPVDVAERRGHSALLSALTPVVTRQVPVGVLRKVQSHFHGVIGERAAALVEEHQLRLPELAPLLELRDPEMWFAVPGMYGGFRYRLERDGVEAQLVVDSWCRVVEGSGQRHEITSQGSRLVAEGFV